MEENPNVQPGHAESANPAVITFLLDENGVFTLSEGSGLHKLGLKPGEVVGKSAYKLYKGYPELIKDLDRAYKGEHVTHEVTMDGDLLARSLFPVMEDGRVKQVIGVTFDITESRRAEQAMQKNEFRFRQLFNSASDAIFMVDNRTFIDCNPATLKIFDCTYDQIVGQTPYRFSPLRQRDGRPSEEAAIEKINGALNGKPQFFEWLHIRHDGTPFDAEVSLNRLDLEGKVYIQAIVRDISARKAAEQENKRLAMVANHTTNMVVVADAKGLVQWVNPAFTQVTGYTLEEMVGKSPGSVLQGKDTDPVVSKEISGLINTGKGFKNLEILNYTKDGKPYWASIEVQPILDENDNIIQFIAIQSDITERKLTQQALLERHEALLKINEELDRFVYSASHDLRAPIASLMGLVEVARMETNPENILPLLNMQKKSLMRMDHFIKDIVDYSRNTRLQVTPESIDFREMIDKAIEQLQFMDNVDKIRKDIEVEQSATFFTSATRLDIILNNLISNAIKYADLTKPECYIKIQVTANEKEAIIRIADNGEGIDEQSQSKIFDMFYRASEKKSGSGLGLYIVKEATDKIGGTIKVNSKLFESSEFTMKIPNMLK